MLRRIFYGLIVLNAFIACSKSDSQSNQGSQRKDIGTDLDVDGSTEGVRLYWRQGPQIIEGNCTAGKPIIRANCQNSQRKVDIDEFQDAVLASFKKEVSSALSELKIPQSDFNSASDRLQDLDSTKLDRDDTFNLIEELKIKVADLSASETVLSEELSKVEEELRVRPSDELKQRRDQLRNELWDVQEDLARRDQSLTHQTKRLKELEEKLATFEPRNDAALDAQRLALDTVEKIKDVLTYEILSTNTRFPKNRPSVKLLRDAFDRIF